MYPSPESSPPYTHPRDGDCESKFTSSSCFPVLLIPFYASPFFVFFAVRSAGAATFSLSFGELPFWLSLSMLSFSSVLVGASLSFVGSSIFVDILDGAAQCATLVWAYWFYILVAVGGAAPRELTRDCCLSFWTWSLPLLLLKLWRPLVCSLETE